MHKKHSKALKVMDFKMNQTSLIEASAGTGKTYTITNLVLRALLGLGEQGKALERPLQIEDMLIVTFTNAATSDLRLRIYERIRLARACFERFLECTLSELLKAAQEFDHKSAIQKAKESIFTDQCDEAAINERLAIVRGKLNDKGTKPKIEPKKKRRSKKQDDIESQRKDAASLTLNADMGLGLLDKIEEGLNVIVDETSLDNLALAKSYDSEELKHLMAELNFPKLFAMSEVKDSIIQDMIKSLVSKGGALLRQAVIILTRAERNINNAAICTIHSFCNSALTQIFALESGAAFNMELKLDLTEEIHEACYGVWRRLFYKRDSSTFLLKFLDRSDPLDVYQQIKALDRVRLSDSRRGYFGYQLRGFDHILETLGITLDYDKEPEEQLVSIAKTLDYEQNKYEKGLINAFESFKKDMPYTLYQEFYDVGTNSLGEKFKDLPGRTYQDYPDVIRKLDVCYEIEKSLSGHKEAYITARNKALMKLKEHIQSGHASEEFENLLPFLGDDITLDGLDTSVLGDELTARVKHDMSKDANEARQAVVEGILLNLLKHNSENLSIELRDELLNFEVLRQNYQNTVTEFAQNMRVFMQEFRDFKGYEGGATACISKRPAPSKEFVELFSFYHNIILKHVQSISDSLQAQVQFEDESYSLLRTLTCIAINFELDKYCSERHLMSTDDVLRKLDCALNSDAEMGSRLASLIRIRYPLAMIDEFQDTDPIQFNIFSKLYLNEEAVKDHAYCYLIGDPKQAIYAFRGSDINSYLRAKSIVEELTEGHGIYTLDTNYRSEPDLVHASNAIFSTTLNPKNHNPFNEENIVFEPVHSGKGELNSKFRPALSIDGLENFTVDEYGIGVYIDNIDEFNIKKAEFEQMQKEEQHTPLAYRQRTRFEELVQAIEEVKTGTVEDEGVDAADADADTDENTEGSEEQTLKTPARPLRKYMANTYVVSLGDDYKNKEQINEAYAQMAATLIRHTLEHGVIKKDGERIKVKEGDIAILVRSEKENSIMEQALRAVGLSSVYFSDRTSVLEKVKSNKFGPSDDSSPSEESLEICYLMEAMLDCTNRRKVLRLLGSRLLSLKPEELLERAQDDNFELEVRSLNRCAKVWQEYGFMPAFMQWSKDPLHNVCSRILDIEDGERLYTNYCHISEIIQNIHNQKGGVQAQLHWFYELIYQKKAFLSADATQKRLESEHDQIKVMTVHKSKGLEYPIIFTPFLWNYITANRNYDGQYFNAVKYYDADESKSVVLDYDLERRIKVVERKAITKEDMLDVYHKKTEEQKENDELPPELEGGFIRNEVYLTPREIVDRDEQCEAIRLLYVALTRAKYAHFLFVGGYKSAKNPGALVTMVGAGDEGAAYLNFMKSAVKHPKLFTVIDGQLFLEAHQSHLYENDALQSPMYDNSNITTLRETDSMPNVAMSFLYKRAIDTKFHILSYSSLVSGNHTGYASKMEDTVGEGIDDGAIDMQSYDESMASESTEQKAEASPENRDMLAFDLPFGRYEIDKEQEFTIYDVRFSVSALAQFMWEHDYYYDARIASHKMGVLCHDFPRGAYYGTLLHECLQEVEFNRIKDSNFFEYVKEELFELFAERADYRGVVDSLGGEDIAGIQIYEWFRDILEAPIVRGKYNCLALADLKAKSFESEMEFLMSNTVFNTTEIDELCRDVANDILPEHLKFLGKDLTLKEEELFGYITGSIDLACRFDLNERLNLRARFDLTGDMPRDEFEQLENNLERLLDKDMETIERIDSTGELRSALEVDMGQDEQDIKYFVIDYKSNHLGEDYESYSEDKLLASIYDHRYDVQFLIYSLALYRFLKRRLGMSFEASYEELEEFYNKHVGGVVYLYLRGMRANYLRDEISSGVYSCKIEFKHIYRLDCIFGADEH